jgi:ribonuclease J
VSEPQVKITPLGGLGEIGMNSMCLEYDGTMLMIDCGLMFPDVSLYGVDVVIPRFDYVAANRDKLAGVILTHGHEDHIGALPWLLKHVDAPLYGSEFTMALVLRKLREHGLEDYVRLNHVTSGDRIEFGDVVVNFFDVCHSIIQGFGLGVETPAGKIVHTGDFKIDPNPLDGIGTDLGAFSNFSRDGVLLMLSDSTNVEREGFALTEREIQDTLKDIFADAKGRILVTLFSSHIQRIQEIFDLAHRFGRKVAVSGRSLIVNIELAIEHRLLHVKEGTLMPLDRIVDLPDENIVLLVTGSQGEPLSALSRIAAGEHKHLFIREGDLVVMSSRFIPGNVRAITKVINDLYRQGAEVLYEKVQAIHASGHAHRKELTLMIEAVKPKFFVPIHGEYRHLVKHAHLASECGVAPERCVVLSNGRPLTLSPSGMRLENEVDMDYIYVDGKGVGDVGRTVLKERQLLGGEGMVVVVLITAEETGEILVGPEITSKGFVFEQHYDHLLEDAKCIVLDLYENTPPDDPELLRDRIHSGLRRFFRKIIDRDPVVVPMVMKV